MYKYLLLLITLSPSDSVIQREFVLACVARCLSLRMLDVGGGFSSSKTQPDASDINEQER